MKIEVKSTAVSVRNGTSATTGKPWEIREQQAYAHCTDRDGNPEAYPQRITINLRDGAQPFPLGEYTLGDASFYVGQYGRLSIGAPVLVSLSVTPRKVA